MNQREHDANDLVKGEGPTRTESYPLFDGDAA